MIVDCLLHDYFYRTSIIPISKSFAYLMIIDDSLSTFFLNDFSYSTYDYTICFPNLYNNKNNDNHFVVVSLISGDSLFYVPNS